MKLLKNSIVVLICLLAAASFLSAQEKLGIITFTAPNGWERENRTRGVRFYKQTGQKDTFAVMMLFKALPTLPRDSKENFDIWWKGLIELDFETDVPQMQPTVTKNGWTIETGTAQAERNGEKATAMLVSAINGETFVNISILKDTDKFDKEISEFIDSVVLPQIKLPQTTRSKSAKPRRLK